MSSREPVFNAPAVVVGVIGLLALVHAVRALLEPAQDLELVLAMALIPARTLAVAAEIPGGTPAVYGQYVTHMLVHGDMAHLVLNSAWMLIFGTAVARRIGALRFLAFTLFCGIAAGLAFVAANQGLATPMIGASGAVSGLMGATIRLLFPALDRGGLWLLSRHPTLVPPQPLKAALTDRRVLLATAAIVALNVLLATGFGAMFSEGGIAWQAHLGGYFAGLLGYGLFDTGGVPRRPMAPPTP